MPCAVPDEAAPGPGRGAHTRDSVTDRVRPLRAGPQAHTGCGIAGPAQIGLSGFSTKPELFRPARFRSKTSIGYLNVQFKSMKFIGATPSSPHHVPPPLSKPTPPHPMSI
eukprot:17586-Hanusia_phi.AAC.1